MSNIIQDSQRQNIFNKAIITIGNYISIFYFVAVIITVFEVFMRYIFNAPTLWVHELTVILVGSSMIYGGSYCMASDGHIRVTIIRDALPLAFRKTVDFVTALLTFIFTVSLTYAGWITVKKAYFTPSGIFRLETSGSAWNSPMPAIIKTVLMIVVCLMCIQAFGQLTNKFINIFRKGER